MVRPQKYQMTDDIREMILDQTLTLTDIASITDIPPRVLSRWSGEMHEIRRKEWEASEERYLRTHVHRMTLAQIASHLKRSPAAVRCKSVRMHLSIAPHDGYTIAQVAAGLGHSIALIRKWMQEGKITAIKRGPTAHAWSFSDESIQTFLQQYPQLLCEKRMGLLGHLWKARYLKKSGSPTLEAGA